MNKPVRLLLVEDNDSCAQFIEDSLKASRDGQFQVTHVVHLGNALKCLEAGDIDLILLDLSLPDSHGLETLKIVHAAAPQIPVIVLTGHSDEEMITEAIREGAQDYLLKDEAFSKLLIRSIRYSIERHRAIIEREELEQRFLQSQKMEAVGRLAGGVAHDFNNLLTAILGYCNILETSMEPQDARLNDLKEIVYASRRAASLTQQLLAFSRRQILAPKVLNFNAVVLAMEQMLRRLIGEDIDLSIALDQGLGNVKADSGQIEQVIMNLVVNAREAMPKGGRISVETKNVVFGEDSPGRHEIIPAGTYAAIEVSDTGCGMDSEMQSHIFEPFFTTKELGKGTGLGLSTVYGIVKQSGGYIWVYSEVSQGSTFKIYFPISMESIEQSVEDKAPVKTLRGTETILLVEDDASVRRMLCRIFERHGYAVLQACDGQKAIDIIDKRSRDIDLILTDIVMPGLGSRGVADHANLVCPQTRIIFMSGYTDDVILRHGRLESGTIFIHKPIAADALMQKIRCVLDAFPRRKESIGNSALNGIIGISCP